MPGKARVQIALNPVIRRTVTKTGHGFQVLGFFTVELSALRQHFFDAVHVGAVRIFSLLAFGVVLAVNRRPLFGDLACCQPQPEAEKMRSNRVQVQRPMGLMAVQENSHADHGDVRDRQGEQNNLPPSDIPEAVSQPVEAGVK